MRRIGYQLFGPVLPVLLPVVLLVGCHAASGEEKAEDMRMPTDDNLIVAGVSQMGSRSVWGIASTASIREASTKKNGYFLIFNNAGQKQENQTKALRSFISQRVDYIVFPPITEDDRDTALQGAKEVGIPVTLIDRKVGVKNQSLYTTWIGSGLQKEGRMAGETLAEYLKARGYQKEDIRMVVLQGTKGAIATIGWSIGFDEMMKLHPNWLILEQVDARSTTAKGQKEMKRLLARYEDIDVVISRNDGMTSGVLDVVYQAGGTVGEAGNIPVTSLDAVEDALKLVGNGIITADTECNPDQGEYAGATIRQLENGKTVDKMNSFPKRILTRESIQGFRNGSDGQHIATDVERGKQNAESIFG